jgi:hypothetical protein
MAFSPGAAGLRAASGASAAGTAADAAIGTGTRPLASGRVTGATAARAEGLPIMSEVSLGSTAGSAAAPGSETSRPII